MIISNMIQIKEVLYNTDYKNIIKFEKKIDKKNYLKTLYI